MRLRPGAGSSVGGFFLFLGQMVAFFGRCGRILAIQGIKGAFGILTLLQVHLDSFLLQLGHLNLGRLAVSEGAYLNLGELRFGGGFLFFLALFKVGVEAVLEGELAGHFLALPVQLILPGLLLSLGLGGLSLLFARGGGRRRQRGHGAGDGGGMGPLGRGRAWRRRATWQ